MHLWRICTRSNNTSPHYRRLDRGKGIHAPPFYRLLGGFGWVSIYQVLEQNSDFRVSKIKLTYY